MRGYIVRLLALYKVDMARGRAIELDAIRGIAILLAMGWHLNGFDTRSSPILRAILLPGARFGWAGVDIFFVLSGFLIGGLIFAEIDKTGRFNTKRFLIRRAFRLWPVLYLYVAAQVALNRFPITSFVPQILLSVQNYAITPIAHLWSLAVEEQFYLCAALLLPVVAKRAGSRRRGMFIALCVVAASATIARTVGWFAGIEQQALQSQTQFRADVLACGIILAMVKLYRPAVYVKLQRYRWAHGLIAALCAVGLYYVYEDMTYRALIGFPLGTLMGVCLILALDGLNPSRLGRSVMVPLAYLGLYSYSMYIWHPGLGRIIGHKMAAVTGSAAIGALCAYGAVIAFGVTLAVLVEQPMIRLRNRLFPSRHEPPKDLVKPNSGMMASDAA